MPQPSLVEGVRFFFLLCYAIGSKCSGGNDARQNRFDRDVLKGARVGD